MKFFSLLGLSFAVLFAYTQTEINVWNFNPTEKVFKNLLQNNASIAANDTVHEEITDLVQPYLAHHRVSRKREHHHVFLLGWMIHALGGYNWRILDPEKQKFVGTVVRHSRNSSEEYTEYDINFDIIFHQKKYLGKMFFAYDRQRKLHRQDYKRKNRRDYKSPPFVRDTNNIDHRLYKLHCELTPPRPFRPQLHYLFYPTLPNLELKNHLNFGTAHPTMGFYGTWCLDCNHSCHPEVHPYEIVWWLKATEDDPTDIKRWHIGVIGDGSNRFPKWSVSPMAASIAIPFAFYGDMDEGESFKIKVEHLVFDKFVDSELKKLKIPDDAFWCDEPYQVFNFVAGDKVVRVECSFSSPLHTKALRYWFSEVNYDNKDNIFSGYFNVGVGVEEIYTTRISFGKTLWD
jgi:hypothetical protein